jgi:Tol biopolymer transport system component
VDARNSLDDAGRFLAYARVRPTESEIWVKDLVLGRDRHLATTPLSQLNPIIAHDGSKVAYTVPEGEKVTGYVIPADGGAATKVCDGCVFQGWFADNRRILLFPGPPAPQGRVNVIDVTNGDMKEALYDPMSAIGRVDVTHDGRWLAFSSRRHVWVAPVRLGAPPPESDWMSVLTVADGSAERACGWSPDGQLLYLLIERDGFRDLYAQRVDASRGTPIGEPFVVQHLHDPRRRWGSTPYGTAIVNQAFVFTQSESTGTIWLMRPWQKTP